MLRFDDPNPYPTDELVAELLAAKNRGVQVRVILETAEEVGPERSKSVNGAAHDYLKAQGIAVKYDDPQSLLHSKLVVIDQEHVVIGSHNWTAGSIYAYDDASLYIASSQLGEYYRGCYGELWDGLPAV